MNTRQEPDWKPRRKGKIYCSPACGCKCTHAAYLHAKEASKAARKELGKGWKANVFETCGWHWNVQLNDSISISPYYPHPLNRRDNKPDHYAVYLNGIGISPSRGKTLKIALANAKASMAQHSRSFVPTMQDLKFPETTLDFLSKLV